MKLIFVYTDTNSLIDIDINIKINGIDLYDFENWEISPHIYNHLIFQQGY